MIPKTIFAISAEESRFTLNGALLLLKSDGLTMVATDGHRLAMVESDVPLPSLGAPYKALLPRKAMQELLKLAGDAGEGAMLRFSGDDNHLFFQLGDRLLITRKLTGQLPGLRARAAEGSSEHRSRCGRDELRSAIERVAQFADERSRAIRLQMVPGEVKVHSSLSETGESEESFPAEYSRSADGDRIQRAVPARFSAGLTGSRMSRFTSGMRKAPARCGPPAAMDEHATAT